MTINLTGISRQSLIGRILRLPLRLIPRHMRVRILQGPMRGMRWIAGASVHGCWLGSFEFDKQVLFQQYVRPGASVLDIGANVGFYTLLSAKLTGPSGAVVAFEPLPRNLEYLRAHVKLNSINHARILDAAVSDKPGEATFSTHQDPSQAKLSNEGDIKVRVVTLDQLFAAGDIPVPNLIKIDVEGAEGLVLRGAAQLLAKHKPVIFLATHGAEVHKDCCDQLLALGYKLKALDGQPLASSSEVLAE
ncbi:MAG: FkbM family methyltransferase [Phycisphaerales bacterium]|nr:FkbM family methyltransferase [Phycisphaerales bacterium]